MYHAVALLQTFLGIFFVTSGWHKLTNAPRRATLRTTLEADLPKLGLPAWCINFMMYWLPTWELIAGFVATFAVPLVEAGAMIIAQLAMLPLIAILGVALYCEGYERVRSFKPIDTLDIVCDAIYLPETLMFIIAVFCAFAPMI